MFNESGGGNLGSASGSIIINTESIEAAVKVVHDAIIVITADFEKLNAAQSTGKRGKLSIEDLVIAAAAASEISAQRQVAAEQKIAEAKERTAQIADRAAQSTERANQTATQSTLTSLQQQIDAFFELEAAYSRITEADRRYMEQRAKAGQSFSLSTDQTMTMAQNNFDPTYYDELMKAYQRIVEIVNQYGDTQASVSSENVSNIAAETTAIYEEIIAVQDLAITYQTVTNAIVAARIELAKFQEDSINADNAKPVQRSIDSYRGPGQANFAISSELQNQITAVQQLLLLYDGLSRAIVLVQQNLATLNGMYTEQATLVAGYNQLTSGNLKLGSGAAQLGVGVDPSIIEGTFEVVIQGQASIRQAIVATSEVQINSSNNETQTVISNEDRKQRAYKATDDLRLASLAARMNDVLNVPGEDRKQFGVGSTSAYYNKRGSTSNGQEVSQAEIAASNEEVQVVITNERQKQRAYKATDDLRLASLAVRMNGVLNTPGEDRKQFGVGSTSAYYSKRGSTSNGQELTEAEAQIAASNEATQIELNNVKMLQEAFASVGRTIPSVAKSIADAQIASSNTATQVELDNVAALTAAWQSAARQRPGTFGLPPSQGGAAGAGGNGGAGGGDPLIDESGQFAKPDDGSGGAGLTGSGSGTRVPFGMRASRALIPFGFLANQLGAGDLAKIIFTAQASLSLVEFIPKLGASFTQLGAQLLAMNGAIGDATNFVVRMVAARATALTAEDAEIITKNTLTAATLAGATAEEAQAAAEAALTEATLAAASGATITSAAIATVFLPIIAVIATIVIAAKLLTDAYNEQKIAAEATAKAISDRTENIKSAVQIGLQGDPGQARAGLSDAQANYLTAQDTQFQLQKQLAYYKSDQFRLDDAARGKNTVQIAEDTLANQAAYTEAVKKAGEATEVAREALAQYTLAQKAAAEVNKFNVPERQLELKSSLTNTSSIDISQQITDNENKITLARIAQIEATKESNKAAQESVLATDQLSRDQADALSRTTKAYAEQQGAIVEDTTVLNTWLTNMLPTIKAREAETKAIEDANQALQKSIDLNKLLVDAANSGNPDDVRKTIADLTNQRQEAQDITLPTYQNRINAANARLGAQSRASGTPVAQLQANDAEYQDAYKGLTATNESIKTFTGEIDHLNTAGIRGATIIQQLGLEEAKILAIRQNVATSSRDLQSGLANDQQDIDVANRAEFAAKNDLYLATKEGRVADIEAARSKIQVYEATKTNAQADIDLLSGLIAIAQARESETRSIDEQRAAIQHNIQYSKDLAQQIRTATAEQAADTLQQNKEATQALKDNLPALEAWRDATKAAADDLDAARIRNDPNLGKIEALAAQANDAAKQFEDAKIQLGQLGIQATDTLTKVVPAAIERATTDFINDVIQMRIDSQQKVADINAKEQEDEANALKKYNDDVAEADKKTKEQALKDQKDFNDRRAKIEEQYRLDFSNAVGDRDALAALKAREKRDKDLNDLTKDYNDQKKELAKALKDQKDVARKHYEESLEQAKDNAAKSLAAEQRRLRDEIAARAAAYQKQLSDLVALGVGGAKILSDMAINGIDSLSVLGNSAALIFANMAANARAAVDASNAPPTSNYGGSGLGTYKPTRYSTGTPYLSQDEIAQLHGGEGVINEAANAVVRQYLGNNYSQSDLAMAVMNGKSGGSSGSGMGTQIAFKMGNISIVATDASEIKRQATGVFHTQLDKALKAAGIK